MKAGCNHYQRPFMCGTCLKVAYCGDACATQDWTRQHWMLCEGKRERESEEEEEEDVQLRYRQYEEEGVHPSGNYSNREGWNLGLPSDEEEEEEEEESYSIPPGYVYWRGMWVPKPEEEPEDIDSSSVEKNKQWVRSRKSTPPPLPRSSPGTVILPSSSKKERGNWSDMFVVSRGEKGDPKRQLNFDEPSYSPKNHSDEPLPKGPSEEPSYSPKNHSDNVYLLW